MTDSNRDDDSPRLETLAAQGLGRIDEVTRAVVPPLHVSSTFVRDPDGGYSSGRGYSRADNPTYDTPEDLIAKLEGAEKCLLFSSGMSAAAAVFQSLLPGDHVIVPRVMYWALRKWINDFPVSWGLEVEFVDTTDVANIDAALRPGRTRLVWLESPANPTWEVSDIKAIAALAHRAGARVAVDNTVATPVLMRPLELGADLVVHSASKYLNGHSDVLAGAVAGAVRDAFWFRIRACQRDGGAVLGPFEAWLLLRGMRTLFPRVRQSSESALTVARHFENHPGVVQVLYPGLPSHPGHALASQQMRGGFTGMLSLRIRGGERAAMATGAAVKIFKRATSLGGVESLLEHRASIEGAASTVPDDMLRLSIGLEHPDDLVADLEQAIAAAGAQSSASPEPTLGSSSTPLNRLETIVSNNIRPVIQDRGGDIAIKLDTPEKIVVTLNGSPGAHLPLSRWIESTIQHHFPDVAAIEVHTHGSSPSGSARHSDVSTGADKESETLAVRVERAVHQAINPGLADHGGAITVAIQPAEPGSNFATAVVTFGGRCQGCALAEVTLRQGIEPLLRRAAPELGAIRDVTVHGEGRQPYFPTGKGGAAK